MGGGVAETSLDRDQVAANMARLRGDVASEDERFDAIKDLGRNYAIGAASDIAAYLDSPEPMLRQVALAALTRYFHLDEYWETARHFVEGDVDALCRCAGATAIAALRRNSHDRASLALLANVVAYRAPWRA